MSETTAKRRTDLDLLRHIWKNIERDGETGCWKWLLSLDERGYGQLGARGLDERQPTRAHRATWILFHGEIPKGMHVHHKCENPICCNPDHLQLLSPSDHLDQHRDPDYCPRGHFFDEVNTAYKTRNGFKSRICRKCDAERQARRRASLEDKWAAPCVWCGEPALRSPRQPDKPAECRPCFYKHAVPHPEGKPGRVSGAWAFLERSAA